MFNRHILPVLTAGFLLSASPDATASENTIKDSSGFAPVNGLQMYYEIHGQGEPLVLVHGGGSTIETSFGIMMPLLAKHYKVVAMELQAHGRTADRNQPESFEQDADDVAALLQWLGIQKAFFLGFSNGGNTVMQVALRHPQLVSKLVLVSAFYKIEGMQPGFFEGLSKASLADMPKPLQDAYLKTGNRQGLQAMFNRDRDRMLHFTDWPDQWLQSIQVPVLLMAGDKDVMLTAHTVKMSQLIPRAQLVILPGVHGALLGEVCAAVPGSPQPSITADLVHAFLG